MFQHKIISIFQNLSLGFILKIFLKIRKFQPRYSYKMYSYRKERVYGVAMLVYLQGTLTWRPGNCVNTWNLLWLSRPLINLNDQANI